MITAEQWSKVLTFCGVRFLTASQWAKGFEARIQPENFSLGARELDDFLGQVLHETARLDSLEEKLSYSALRMTQVWPQRFPTISDAAPYAYNPEALANKVYGARADLGNTQPGDGWRFHGRGIPQITGRANYALLEKLTGLPLLEKPDLLLEPDTALRCAVLWWEKKVPDSAIDTIERVTRAVNGRDIGLADRQALTLRAHDALLSIGIAS